MHALRLRPATPKDAEFLFQTLKATMREYVDQTWGWDEEWQRAYFQKRFDPAKNQIIVLDDRDIGVIAAEKREDEVFLLAIFKRLYHEDGSPKSVANAPFIVNQARSRRISFNLVAQITDV